MPFSRAAVSNALHDHTGYVGYDRQISTRTTVGARVSATHTDYNGPGDVWVITPQATVQTALSDRLTFSRGARFVL